MADTVQLEGPAKMRGNSERRAAYDAHHPPSLELIDQCVHCGFCLPACPTYQLWNQEMDSPRGRIYLMKMAAEGGVPQMDATFVSHFDRCLGCMACMPACPSGVQYGKLIEATRAQIERNYRRPLLDRLFRKLIFAVFPHPKRLRWLALPLWLYQRSGLRWLLRKTGLLRVLPARLQSLEALLPELHLRALFGVSPALVPARRLLPGTRAWRVGVLTGCVQRVFFNDVNAATIRVLAALGCEVVVPREQGCCGALMAHAGGEAQAERSARKLIDVFERADVDVIAINAAGCGSHMKDYAHLLRDDPEYGERARLFAAKCRDITEVITDLLPLQTSPTLAVSAGEHNLGAPFNRIPFRIAYHEACHLQHAQGVRVQPRQLLNAINGLEVIELTEPGTCCGSAGIYNLVEPKTAMQLGDRKARHVLESGAQALVSANPGCLLQIASALKRAGHPMPVFHIVELLDTALASGRLKITE